MTTFKDARTGAAITVKVTPKAKKTQVAGVMDDGTLKIHIAAPAEEGRANAALIDYLARLMGITPGQVEIVAGLASERKLISLVGVSPMDVDARVKAAAKKESAVSRSVKAAVAKAKAKKKK